MAQHPASAPLEDGLFELRGKKKTVQARLIYYFEPDKRIVFVYACYKDRERLRRRDIESAKKNRERIKKEGAKIYAIN